MAAAQVKELIAANGCLYEELERQKKHPAEDMSEVIATTDGADRGQTRDRQETRPAPGRRQDGARGTRLWALSGSSFLSSVLGLFCVPGLARTSARVALVHYVRYVYCCCGACVLCVLNANA